MSNLDMSLDDMIKSRRTTEKGSRGRGGKTRRGRGGQGGGPVANGRRPTGQPRKGPLRVNARPSAHTIAKPFRRPKSLPWQRDLLEESLKSTGLPGLDDGAKLYVSNLDIGVTNEDIRELFSEIGELKRYAIHYDKSGRPNGTAEVMFTRRSDAFQALKRYNNVQLDGKPMRIEIVGSKSDAPLAPRVNVVGGVNGQRTVVMMPGAGRGRRGGAFNRISGRAIRGGAKSGRGGAKNVGGGRGRGSGRGQGGGGRGRGRGKKGAVEKSADELDKELENYHAMQT
ncbi:THO complex subunit 4D-like [Rutidosis leptorrhynchoides]|uniref:THO complex subunit 4D-like n=1 Tax=Rutidosis leptorrhynchoides TaxID=125765 RepID=UPI003A99E0E7